MNTFRIVLLGNESVGKSALTIRLLKNYFEEKYEPTIEDIYQKKVIIDNRSYCLDILDTAGKEEYTAMTNLYIRAGEGFILVFDVDSTKSFEDIRKHREKMKKLLGENQMPMVLVGNKCDLPKPWAVNVTQAIEEAKEYGIPFIQTSAKTGMGVDDVFKTMVREIRKDREIQHEAVLHSLRKR
ncbi:GTPase HRas [Copidosoma floridanum]|uniref:GTPase HRas n=1 Tax=Copidosoma floridanum TaxID=29053 RepID=UPI0006C956C6|nr:GTPase HRas [Copidosoma floridanum]